jgi:hypothetical protein
MFSRHNAAHEAAVHPDAETKASEGVTKQELMEFALNQGLAGNDLMIWCVSSARKYKGHGVYSILRMEYKSSEGKMMGIELGMSGAAVNMSLAGIGLCALDITPDNHASNINARTLYTLARRRELLGSKLKSMQEVGEGAVQVDRGWCTVLQVVLSAMMDSHLHQPGHSCSGLLSLCYDFTTPLRRSTAFASL